MQISIHKLNDVDKGARKMQDYAYIPDTFYINICAYRKL